MDGRILENTLKRMGLDRQWLHKQLKQNQIHSPEEAFLAVRDRNLILILNRKL